MKDSQIPRRALLAAGPLALAACSRAEGVDAQLRKPFLRGPGDNLLDRQQFKYVWIETDWRPRR